MKANAFVSSIPTLTFSKYPNLKNKDAMVSLPTLRRMSKGVYKSVEDIPLRACLFHIDSSTLEEREMMVKDLGKNKNKLIK